MLRLDPGAKIQEFRPAGLTPAEGVGYGHPMSSIRYGIAFAQKAKKFFGRWWKQASTVPPNFHF